MKRSTDKSAPRSTFVSFICVGKSPYIHTFILHHAHLLKILTTAMYVCVYMCNPNTWVVTQNA